MAKCLFILAWVFIFGMLFQKSSIESEPKTICEGYNIYRSRISYIILLFSVPFVFVAFRTAFVDTETYIRIFNALSIDKTLSKAIESFDGSELYYGLEYLFKKYVSSDAQFFLVVIASLHTVLLLSTLRKYSENFGMSIYVFVASAMILSWMCNGIRQFLVVVILFAMTGCIIKNRWYIYLPTVLFLGGFTPIFKFFGWNSPPWFFCGIHQSALIMIPIYFIVRGKALTKKNWILLVALLLLSAFGLLDRFLETSTQNTMYAEDLTLISNTKGASPTRFLVSLVPVLLVVIKRKEIASSETPSIINTCINMSFVSSTLYLASVFTSGMFVGRLPIYCELYNLILIPWLVNHLYSNDKKILTIAVYIFYFIYFLYQIFVPWGNELYIINLFGNSF